MRHLIQLAFISAFFTLSCGTLREESPGPKTPTPVPAVSAKVDAAAPKDAPPEASPGVLGSKAARELCFETDTGDTDILKSQTFAIEFEPYRGSCFITSYNPEFDDPPMESDFAIYRDGKKVADFPGKFNGATFGCWVDAVSFQDLNEDGLVDVIVAGKCSAKNAVYNENMVYANTGKGFTTNEDGNIRLSDFSTIKEIANFAKDNKQVYFK